MSSRSQHGRRRRTEPRTPVDLYAEARLLAALFAVASRPTQQERNVIRMGSCSILWRTPAASIGVCPGFDDFLVWTEPDSMPGVAVPMTHEVIDDFAANVLPALRLYAVEDGEAEAEYVLGICKRIIDGQINVEDPFSSPYSGDDSPSRQAAGAAQAEVVEALQGFLDRNGSEPDL